MTDPAQNRLQPYDSLLKHLFRSEADKIVPLLLPGAKLVSDGNIEIDRSTLKVDLALKIRYKGTLAILNFESQSGADEQMEKRISIYNAGLHSTYGLPVISILLYLFKCATVESPYHVQCVDRKCSSCYYDVIRLWEEDPEPYIDHHAVPLYVLLPGMKNPSVALLKQTIKEMYEYYDERRAGERLGQFGVMLIRTTTVSASNKQIIQEELSMYSPYMQFLSQNPDIKALMLQKEREGKIEGEIKGEIKGKIDSILTILDFRFSNNTLLDLAKQALGGIQDIHVLGKLEYEALRASDEQDIHKWLDKYLPQSKVRISETQDETEDKIKNRILKILHRLQFSAALLELAAQALSHIHDIKVLNHFADVALDSEDEQDVHRWLLEYVSHNNTVDKTADA